MDVITLLKNNEYDTLQLSVGEAIRKRPTVRGPAPTQPKLTDPEQDFPGIYTCTLDDGLDTIFETIRKSRVHRLVIVDENNALQGVLSLSDILAYILLEGEPDHIMK